MRESRNSRAASSQQYDGEDESTKLRTPDAMYSFDRLIGGRRCGHALDLLARDSANCRAQLWRPAAGGATSEGDYDNTLRKWRKYLSDDDVNRCAATGRDRTATCYLRKFGMPHSEGAMAVVFVCSGQSSFGFCGGIGARGYRLGCRDSSI